MLEILTTYNLYFKYTQFLLLFQASKELNNYPRYQEFVKASMKSNNFKEKRSSLVIHYFSLND